MNWYRFVKFLHVSAVAITIGSMFARQLVRGIAKRSDDVNEIASLTRAAVRMYRALVIPFSNLMALMGIILAVMLKWPIFGFLQGAEQNWLLVSNVLLVTMMVIIMRMFLPHNRMVDALRKTALAEGNVTPELRTALNDRKKSMGAPYEAGIFLLIAALMVLKPF